MDQQGVPKALPCAAESTQAVLWDACHKVLTSKAEAFLQVRASLEGPCNAGTLAGLTALRLQAGKAQIRERRCVLAYVRRTVTSALLQESR